MLLKVVTVNLELQVREREINWFWLECTDCSEPFGTKWKMLPYKNKNCFDSSIYDTRKFTANHLSLEPATERELRDIKKKWNSVDSV